MARLSPLERAAVLLAVAMERAPSLVWIDGAAGAPTGAAAIAARLGGADLTIVTSEAAPEAHERAAIELAPGSAEAEDREAEDARAAAEAATASAGTTTDTGEAPAGELATTGADR